MAANQTAYLEFMCVYSKDSGSEARDGRDQSRQEVVKAAVVR